MRRCVLFTKQWVSFSRKSLFFILFQSFFRLHIQITCFRLPTNLQRVYRIEIVFFWTCFFSFFFLSLNKMYSCELGIICQHYNFFCVTNTTIIFALFSVMCKLLESQHIKSRKFKWIIKNVLNVVEIQTHAMAVQKLETCWYIFRKSTVKFIFTRERERMGKRKKTNWRR